ncbi:MAG: TetR/AcrR family transcriptional regulator [Lachnospiraceae bacterium]|nr:TetR/AcrR family transcriptional regulator [Lachnospiraceae bacterium]MDY2758822.1 TetR/AcrR family transcriptional regulator [Lachnospiraceae bacterium]
MSVIRNNSSDLRVQKTVKAVKQALVTLIMQKPYRQIRVDELDKEAMINRQTFYSHFASIDNVLEAIGEDMLGELQEGLKALVPADLRGGWRFFTGI